MCVRLFCHNCCNKSFHVDTSIAIPPVLGEGTHTNLLSELFTFEGLKAEDVVGGAYCKANLEILGFSN